MYILNESKPASPEELLHYGIKGMKWGVRKDRDASETRTSKKRFTPEQKARAKKVAIGAGVLLAAAGAIFVAHHLNKNGKVPVDSIAETAFKGRESTQKVLKEPVDIIFATRGKNRTSFFMKEGGLDDALLEYESAFGTDTLVDGFFKRYGKKGEKIAASFEDPDGRRDFSGRRIVHQIVVPESMTSGIHGLDDVKSKIWPLLKDQYDAIYDN